MRSVDLRINRWERRKEVTGLKRPVHSRAGSILCLKEEERAQQRKEQSEKGHKFSPFGLHSLYGLAEWRISSSSGYNITRVFTAKAEARPTKGHQCLACALDNTSGER
jgi:hypothetical protein